MAKKNEIEKLIDDMDLWQPADKIKMRRRLRKLVREAYSDGAYVAAIEEQDTGRGEVEKAKAEIEAKWGFKP